MDTMKTLRTLKTALVSALAVISFSTTSVVAQEVASPDTLAVMQNLKRLYPKTQFSNIRETNLPGIYEVVMGRNIAYVEGSGRHFIFGHLFDMPTQTDLTQQRKDQLGLPSVAANDVRDPAPGQGAPARGPQAEEERRIDFATLPRQDALQIVKGNGKRRLAVFSDPDCQYCKRLEENLVGLENATIDVYLFPIAQLHGDAPRKSKAVWCSKDKVRAWADLMTAGKDPGNQADCPNPVDRNVALANKLGVRGTPTIVLPSGRVIPGAIPLASLNQMLDGEQR
jgi:thiol:disulfide interchange protein DsbC